jgi:hypothetical protein
MVSDPKAYARDGMLHHVWHAWALNMAAACIEDIGRESTSESRQKLYAVVQRELENERERELAAAYDELKNYFEHGDA